jgi:hypothetical protein
MVDRTVDMNRATWVGVLAVTKMCRWFDITAKAWISRPNFPCAWAMAPTTTDLTAGVGRSQCRPSIVRAVIS